MTLRQDIEEAGCEALQRLFEIALRDSGRCGPVACFLLPGVHRALHKPGRAGSVGGRHSRLQCQVPNLFGDMNTLHARHGLSTSQTSAMIQQVIRYLRQHLAPPAPLPG